MNDSTLILSSTAQPASTSMSARVTKVETELSILRSNHAHIWTVLDELQRTVPSITNTLNTLVARTDFVDRDRRQILEGLERLSERLTPVVTTVNGQGLLLAEHISDCERDRVDRAVLATERHEENQDALRAMDRRTKRVERIYYFVATAIVILGFLSSDLGVKLYNQLFHVASK